MCAGRATFATPLTRPGELAEAWRSAGLIDVRDTMLTISMDFASFADYWAPHKGRDDPSAEYYGDARSRAEEPGMGCGLRSVRFWGARRTSFLRGDRIGRCWDCPCMNVR